MTERFDSTEGQQMHIEIAGECYERVSYGCEAEDWGADRRHVMIVESVVTLSAARLVGVR